MAYDVGAIVRKLQGDFRLFSTSDRPVGADEKNAATPENLRVLLESLDRLTDSILEQRSEGLLPVFRNEAWDTDMVHWQGRLGAYLEAADAAPDGDRQSVLWSVTAPLLLGFFGGEASSLPRQTPDVATPFSLANQLSVAQSWRDERLRLLYEDLRRGASDLVSSSSAVLLILGVLAAGALVVSILRR